MAKPNSRQTLIDYCLRRLGDPVIEINVDEDQLDDRLDEAIDLFMEYHSDASRNAYLKHQVTADDVTNGYIDVNTDVLFVTRMMPLSGNNSSNWMSANYQLKLNDIRSLHGSMGDIGYYTQTQQHISLLNTMLTGAPQITYAHHQRKIYIHGEFETGSIKAGDYIIFEVKRLINPDLNTSYYNDKFLKEYLTQLIKQQWGSNLIKFEGMQLPGGVTMNGTLIYEQATQALEKLADDLRLEHELPVDFYVG